MYGRINRNIYSKSTNIIIGERKVSERNIRNLLTIIYIHIY